MDKKIKKIVIVIIIAIIVIVLGLYFSKYSSDPFGTPPKGVTYNCGPEDRYRFDVTINSEENFVGFLKTHEINDWVRLDDFKIIDEDMDYADIQSAEVDWNNVLKEVKTERLGFKTVYVLDYNPHTCSGFTLKMTDDGHVSVYGCCGK